MLYKVSVAKISIQGGPNISSNVYSLSTTFLA